MTERTIPGVDLRRRRPTLDAAVEQQLREVRQVAGKTYELRAHPQCRICQDDRMKKTVNLLLSKGMPYQGIVDLLEPINEARPKNRRITYDSVWNHSHRHFNIEDPAQRLWRKIVEESAEAHDRDYIGGVESLVDVWSFLAVVRQRGFEAVMDPKRDIPPELGMAAAVKMHELARRDAGAMQYAEMVQKLNRIVAAMREHVPEKYWPAIRATIAGDDQEALEAEVVEEDWGSAVAEDFEFDHDSFEEETR